MDYQACQLCIDHHMQYSSSAKIHIESKPDLEYNSIKWKPEIVKVLFIAEAPPYYPHETNKLKDSYFYNTLELQKFLGAPAPLLGTLSWNLFYLLEINNTLDKKTKLELFKNRSCYYIETIKCRAERYDNKSILNDSVKNCLLYLEKEITDCNPKSIVIMGERALYAIKQSHIFTESIKFNNLIDLLEETKDKPLIANGYNIFFIPLPIWRNRLYLPSILDIFRQIKKTI
ncbi:MAG: uracil-DNA glycosylase family protein [Candidatus Thorarchaeota archaeon]